MKNKLMGDKDDKKKSKPVPVKIVSEGPAVNSDMDKRWRAEQDLRDLSRANEIRSDKERMKAVQALAKAQLKSVTK